MNTRTMATMAAAAATLAVAGCQSWAPAWSEVTGARYYNVTELNTAPVLIEKIDGNSAFPNRRGDPIRIEPGQRNLEMQAYPLRGGGWPGGGNLEYMTLEAQPCKRYFVNGRYDNPLGRDWKPYISYVEDIAGCGGGAPR